MAKRYRVTRRTHGVTSDHATGGHEDVTGRQRIRYSKAPSAQRNLPWAWFEHCTSQKWTSNLAEGLQKCRSSSPHRRHRLSQHAYRGDSSGVSAGTVANRMLQFGKSDDSMGEQGGERDPKCWKRSRDVLLVWEEKLFCSLGSPTSKSKTLVWCQSRT